MIEIPLLNIPRQSLVVRLSEMSVGVTVWWQSTDLSWYVSLDVPVRVPVVSGVRLALDTDALAGLVHPLAGGVWCRSRSDMRIEPGSAPWLDTHRLVYEP